MVVKVVILSALQVEKGRRTREKNHSEGSGQLTQKALRRKRKVCCWVDSSGPLAHHVYFSDLHISGSRSWYIS